MDPVTQVLAQQQSGSAEGQGFGQFAVQGAQLKQEGQRIKLEDRRVQMDEALLPVRKQLLAAQAAQMGQAYVVAADAATAITERNDSLPQFFALQRAFMDSPKGHTDPLLLDQLDSLQSRYPHVMAVPGPAQDMLLAVKGSAMYRQQIAQARQAQEAFAHTSEYVSELDSQGHIRFGERANHAEASLTQLGKLRYERAAALAKGDLEGVQQYDDAIKAANERKSVEPDFIRTLRFYEERTGTRFDPDEVQKMVEYHTGLRARPGVEHTETFPQFFDKHVNKAMDQPIVKTANGTYRNPKSRDEAREALKKEYETINGPTANAPVDAQSKHKTKRYNPATGRIE